MDDTSVFSVQFWVGQGMGRFFSSLDLRLGAQDGPQFSCEISDSLKKKKFKKDVIPFDSTRFSDACKNRKVGSDRNFFDLPPILQ